MSPFQENSKVVAYRQQTAQLLNGVLAEALTPQQAVNHWPCPQGVDASIDLAMQALLHFESDEDEQQTELYYLDAQLQWLGDIANVLSVGESLSPAMLQGLTPDLSTGYYDPDRAKWGPLLTLFQWLAKNWRLFIQALRDLSGRFFA